MHGKRQSSSMNQDSSFRRSHRDRGAMEHRSRGGEKGKKKDVLFWGGRGGAIFVQVDGRGDNGPRSEKKKGEQEGCGSVHFSGFRFRVMGKVMGLAKGLSSKKKPNFGRRPNQTSYQYLYKTTKKGILRKLLRGRVAGEGVVKGD